MTCGLLITLLGPVTAAAEPAARPGRGGNDSSRELLGDPVGAWRNGLIAFAERRPRLPPRVTVIRPDGTGKRAITRGHDPAFSLDGRRLALVRDRRIFVFDIATGRITRVAGVRGSSPSWSPDGRQIVVGGRLAVTVLGGGTRVIYGHNADAPSWAPDGKRIAFVSADTAGDGTEHRCGWTQPFDVYTIEPSGKGLRRLTSDGNNFNPAWSPDGRRIAYFSVRSFVELWLMTMNADGSDKRVVRRIGEGVYPWVCWRAGHLGLAWAPDGRKFTLVAGPDIVTLDVDGSAMRRVTSGRDKIDWQRVPAETPTRS